MRASLAASGAACATAAAAAFGCRRVQRRLEGPDASARQDPRSNRGGKGRRRQATPTARTSEAASTERDWPATRVMARHGWRVQRRLRGRQHGRIELRRRLAMRAESREPLRRGRVLRGSGRAARASVMGPASVRAGLRQACAQFVHGVAQARFDGFPADAGDRRRSAPASTPAPVAASGLRVVRAAGGRAQLQGPPLLELRQCAFGRVGVGYARRRVRRRPRAPAAGTDSARQWSAMRLCAIRYSHVAKRGIGLPARCAPRSRAARRPGTHRRRVLVAQLAQQVAVEPGAMPRIQLLEGRQVAAAQASIRSRRLPGVFDGSVHRPQFRAAARA